VTKANVIKMWAKRNACRVKTALTGKDGATILGFRFMQQTTID